MNNIIYTYIIPTYHLKFDMLFKYMTLSYQKSRIYSLLKDKDKINCLLSEIFTKVIYSLVSKKKMDLIHIERKNNGKPFIENCIDFFFNISHSTEYIIFTHTNQEIGCDIELIQYLEKSIIYHFFTKNEIILFENKTNKIKPNFFSTLVWTRKEAFFKLKGTGISDEITSIETVISTDKNCYFCSYVFNNYIISLCSHLKKNVFFKYVNTLEFLNILNTNSGGNYGYSKNNLDLHSLCRCFSNINIPKVELFY